MSPLTGEQKDELQTAFATNRARQDALTKARRFAAGEFSVELEPASDDPPVSDPEFQRGLSDFGASLRAADVPYSQTAIALDAVDAHGYPLPEFIIAMKAMGPTAVAAVGAAAGAWIQARYGRKARLKIGEVEAEARTVAEVAELLKIAAEYQDGDQGRGGE